MNGYVPVLMTESPNFLDLGHGNEMSSSSSSFSSPSSSLAPEQPRKQKKFLPPDPEQMACDLADAIQNSAYSGECDLAQLQLVSVPTGLALHFLVTLILSQNQLTELPEYLFEGKNCQNLVTLDANSNKLKKIPKSLFSLTRLEVVLLDHNNISALPFPDAEEESSGGNTFLPALTFVGLEFNDLLEFPVEFLIHCPKLKKLFLGQNEAMLEAPVPTERLLQSVIAERYAERKEKQNDEDDDIENYEVLLKVDNRPRFLDQVEKEKWDIVLPWLNIELHKIYPDKILGFMYLGSLRTAQTRTVYHDLNIGYILSIARDLDVRVEPGMKHLELPVEDIPGEDIRPLFEKAFKFIDEARDANKGVLLHCFAGLSRSVTVAAAYIMNRYNMTRDEALHMIREARPAAQPNSGFMALLAEYEKMFVQ